VAGINEQAHRPIDRGGDGYGPGGTTLPSTLLALLKAITDIDGNVFTKECP
jgi:hypothetical protein